MPVETGAKVSKRGQGSCAGPPRPPEYPYGCAVTRRLGKLDRMTTRRTPEYSARPGRPVGRTALAGLALAVVAGLAWVGGMIYTIAGWTG